MPTTITQKLTMDNISFDVSTSRHYADFFTPSNIKITLYADANTVGRAYLTTLNAGDQAMVEYESTGYIISATHMNAVTTTTATTVKPTATPVQRPAGPSVHTATVFFHEFVQSPPGSAVLYTLRVTRTPTGKQPVFDCYITKSTVFSAGLLNLQKGQELYVEFLQNAELLKVDVIESETEIMIRALEESLEEVMAEVVPVEPEKWVNLCKQDMMFRCSTRSRDDRKGCHFWDQSLGRYGDCSHYRESMAHACDCVKAHKHLVEFGSAVVGTTAKTREADSTAYDEILKEKFGKKI